ncbi:hypothetical protein CBR_g11165 [Chara braunii]|uniref:Reverse transcriptase domain-containing protein n=1 Tax=Chara braunii TaxID=69332 RepID=A0A388KQA5_CHABU|nr:hypothetical protein CBR_g11165 [Chara braunii]|eukprot:GBG72234.1 hypothetical protein CBR_g11165 [Chara braunii]
MGICNAPAMFQRAMNMTFQNFVNKTQLTQGMINFFVIVYMGDILVYSETYHGHAQHIEWTLGALRDAGFNIALEKSEFFLPEISFLGYVATRGGLRPDSRKVVAVKEAPVPTSLTQVRAFLGLASYYRRFIKVHSHHGLATGSDFRYSRAEEEAEEESEGELRREVGEAAARLAEDEEEEREAAEESAEAEEEEEEEAGEETSEEEEEAYSEHNEGEPSEEEYEDDDEEVESGDDQEPTRDDELEWVPGPDRREGSPEAAAQRKKEVAEGKRSAIDPPLNDSSKDLELPKPEHGNLAAMTSNVVTTRRRPRS